MVPPTIFPIHPIVKNLSLIKKGFPIVANLKETLSIICGAEGEIRTPTPVRALDPEPSASYQFRHFGKSGNNFLKKIDLITQAVLTIFF